jgi:hypothetical protein
MTRWKRVACGAYRLVDEADREIGLVLKMEYCTFWYPYLWGCDEPDGIRFRTMRQAKAYVEAEIAKGPDDRWEPDPEDVPGGLAAF